MRLLKLMLLGVFLTGFSSMAKAQSEDDFTEYLIEKGEQRATFGFDIVSTSTFKFKCKFDKSAQYKTQNPENQADINKLYGFSDCYSSHQENSARFGWRWYQNKLEIHAYCYVNGERVSEFISAIEPEKIYAYEIERTDKSYIFKLGSVIKEIKRGCQGQSLGYKLYPFFGGDETAPQKIKILIEDID
jgi:hypothetical protein